VVKWWERFWGLVWMVGTLAIAYVTARWMAANAAPLDLGSLRYGLIGTAGLFGLLLGALTVSLIVIGLMSLLERLLARAGYPLRPPDALPLPQDGAADVPTNADSFADPVTEATA
jgi:hypothetical protein